MLWRKARGWCCRVSVESVSRVKLTRRSPRLASAGGGYCSLERVESRVSSCRGGVGVVQGRCPDQGLGNALCSLHSPGIATTNQTRFASACASPVLLKHDLAVPECACRVRVQTTVPLPATRQFTSKPARERQRQRQRSSLPALLLLSCWRS